MSRESICTWKTETERPKSCEFETISQLYDYLLKSEHEDGEELFIRVWNGKRDVRVYLRYDGEDWSFLESKSPLGERYYDYLVYLNNKIERNE